MSTDRQVAANRSNAQKSTGPRTTAGRVASSANARQHGLTGALDESAVLTWYRVILNDVEATPEPLRTDPCLRAAVDLARAEAHLHRVREAEERWLLEPGARPAPGEEMLLDIQRQMRGVAEEFGWNRRGLRLLERADRVIARSRGKGQAKHKIMGRTLARYRASAEARRRSALRRWTEQIAKRSQSGGDI